MDKNKKKKPSSKRATAQARESFAEFLSEYISSGLMEEDFSLLPNKERIHYMLKMAEFCVPKLQAVTADINATTKTTIEDTLIKLAEANE